MGPHPTDTPWSPPAATADVWQHSASLLWRLTSEEEEACRVRASDLQTVLTEREFYSWPGESVSASVLRSQPGFPVSVSSVDITAQRQAPVSCDLSQDAFWLGGYVNIENETG